MTKFEKFKETLTPEVFTQMVVKIVIINKNEPYYITSYGQLFPFTDEGYKTALETELNYWNSEV